MSRRIVAEVLRERARSDEPARPFVKCGGDWLSCRELDEVSERVAAGLVERGLTQGDVVAFILPNCQEMIELFFACAKLGIVQVPLNYWLKGEFLAYQLRDCQATVLIADTAGCRAAASHLGDTAITRIITTEEFSAADASLPTESYATLRKSGGRPPEVELSDSALVSVIYTSGTTGFPKGCMLPNGYYIANAEAFGTAGWVEQDDRIFTAFPLFHTSGQTIALMAALVTPGGSIAIEESFSASRFMARARDENATMLWGVGPMGMAILAQPETASDASCNFRLACWLPMHPVRQAEFERRFNTPVICEVFGQTECIPTTIASVKGPRKPGTGGRPMPYLDVRIVDDADREVSAGAVGEIVIRPQQPGVMFQGYWQKPQDTVRAFRNLWHHTGDFGRFDEDGCLTFVDRKKDAVRRRGENVSSVELEIAIMQHPGVERAAITSVPSPMGEDDIKASIVCHPGADLKPEDLFEFFKHNVPYFAIPRYVELRDELPLSTTNRVRKHELRAEGLRSGTWDFDKLGLTVGKHERRQRASS